MKQIAITLGLSIAILAHSARANPKDDEFEKIAKDYVEGYLASHPENATELGDHRFDNQASEYPNLRGIVFLLEPNSFTSG